jgi:hypothetical protein
VQNAVNVNAGGTLAITNAGASFQVSGSNNALTTNTLNVNATGKVDLGSAMMLVTNGNANTIYNQIQQASGNVTSGGYPSWNGTAGITSSLAAADAASHPGSYTAAVGYYNTGSGIKVGLAVPGDLYLTGAVSTSYRSVIANSESAAQGSLGWSQGDFYYNGTVDAKDAAAELANEGVATPHFVQSAKGITPLDGGGSSGPVFLYNNQTGGLYIDNTNPNLSGVGAFGIYLENPPADKTNLNTLSFVDNSVPEYPLPYTFNPLLYNVTGNKSIQWQSQYYGDYEDLPTGYYQLGTLPTGLTAADFGSGLYGVGDTSGAAFYADDAGNVTNSVVEIVPEPGSLALLAVGIAVAGGAWCARRRRATAEKTA